MKVLNVLVACEESQRVCSEFRRLGHNAFSCDLLECSGGHPEWHFHQDVLKVIEDKGGILQTGEKYYIDGNWDLMIAHPPCTFLAVSGLSFITSRTAGLIFVSWSRFWPPNFKRASR